MNDRRIYVWITKDWRSYWKADSHSISMQSPWVLQNADMSSRWVQERTMLSEEEYACMTAVGSPGQIIETNVAMLICPATSLLRQSKSKGSSLSISVILSP